MTKEMLYGSDEGSENLPLPIGTSIKKCLHLWGKSAIGFPISRVWPIHSHLLYLFPIGGIR